MLADLAILNANFGKGGGRRLGGLYRYVEENHPSPLLKRELRKEVDGVLQFNSQKTHTQDTQKCTVCTCTGCAVCRESAVVQRKGRRKVKTSRRNEVAVCHFSVSPLDRAGGCCVHGCVRLWKASSWGLVLDSVFSVTTGMMAITSFY